jgi:signal transduction histidine kinase
MRLLPASLSARLLLAMLGSVIAAQLVGGAVFHYDRQVLEARWSALAWSERIADLGRMLDTLNEPARRRALAALSRSHDTQVQPAIQRVPLRPRADAEFLRLFRERIAQLPRGNDIITIGPEKPDEAPDIELTTLPDLPATSPAEFYDVHLAFTDASVLTLRLQVVNRAAPTPSHFYLYPVALTLALFVGAWLMARGITIPLAQLVSSADALGRGLPQAPLPEKGPRELRRAAHAFNSMQDRLRRYLDSRTRVVAAMSHDLRTPITRMRLRAEAVTDTSLQNKLVQDLEEMQFMVQGALDMLQGLQSSEPVRAINIDALLIALRDDYAELGFPVTVRGSMREPLLARPQALRRLLTNLLDNCRQFATHAWLELDQSAREVLFRVRDDGPGIPEDQLERVLEPYYRVEGSRGRATGGIGLGLSIARDIAQAHGGELRLRNLQGGGLEAAVSIPRDS